MRPGAIHNLHSEFYMGCVCTQVTEVLSHSLGVLNLRVGSLAGNLGVLWKQHEGGSCLAVQTHTRGYSHSDVSIKHLHAQKQAPSLKPMTITHINTHTPAPLINVQMGRRDSLVCAFVYSCLFAETAAV